MFNLTEITNKLLKVSDSEALTELRNLKSELQTIKSNTAKDAKVSTSYFTDTYFEGRTAAIGRFFGASAGSQAAATPLNTEGKPRKTIRVKNNYNRSITVHIYALKDKTSGAATYRILDIGGSTVVTVAAGEEVFIESMEYPVLESPFPGMLIRLGMTTGTAMTGNAELDMMAGVL